MLVSKDELIELCKKDGGKLSVNNVVDAYRFCKKIAGSHYENFPVGSVLIPKKFRNYIFAVYCFARIADDISDELTEESSEFRINKLKEYKENLINISNYSNGIGNPIFVALFDTIQAKNIPIETLEKLLIAFVRDATFTQAKNIEELLDYCTYSANPIGELILRIFDMYNEQNAELSDKICTSLQLINFWQDLSKDLINGRSYIPENYLNLYNVQKENLFLEKNSVNFKSCISVIYNYTEQLMKSGSLLPLSLRPYRLKLEIALTIEGGLCVLNKCRELSGNILVTRPKLTKKDFFKIFYNAITKY